MTIEIPQDLIEKAIRLEVKQRMSKISFSTIVSEEVKFAVLLQIPKAAVKNKLNDIIKSNEEQLKELYMDHIKEYAKLKVEELMDPLVINYLVQNYRNEITKQINGDSSNFRASVQKYLNSAIEPVFDDHLKAKIYQYVCQSLDLLKRDMTIEVTEKDK